MRLITALLCVLVLTTSYAFADGAPDPDLMRDLAQPAATSSPDTITIPGSSEPLPATTEEGQRTITTLFFASLIILVLVGLFMFALDRLKRAKDVIAGEAKD